MGYVLVVEDDPMIREMVRVVLSRAGHRVAEAASLAAAHASVDAQAPDLLVADLGLPDGDGDQIIRRVQALGAIPVIAMSGRSKGTRLPVQRFLRKPLPLQQLVGAVDELLGQPTPTPVVDAPPVSVPTLPAERLAALAGVSEALARSTPDELPVRSVLRRYLDAPGVQLAAVYRPGAAGLPELVSCALADPLPHRQVASFFGRGDVLSAADVPDDILIDLTRDDDAIADLLDQAKCERMVIAPLVFARRSQGVLVLGFGVREEHAPSAFVRVAQSQVVLLFRVAALDEDTAIQLIHTPSSEVHRFGV